MNKLFLASCAAAVAAALSAAALAGPGTADHGRHSKVDREHTDHGTANHGDGHSGGGHGHMMDMAVGEPGAASDVRRTLKIVMTDNRYSPKSITVSKGETVRFVIENKGEFVHEFNIGTAEMHKAHQGEMMAMMQSGSLMPDHIDHSKMGDMQHDDPNSVLLEPGQTGEVVWKFGTSGEIQFACNVPGHYEDGMHGRVKVR